MIRITVAPDQAEKLRKSPGSVEFIDEQGELLGCYVQAFSQAEIKEAKRRSAAESGGRTTAEVLARLAQMEQK